MVNDKVPHECWIGKLNKEEGFRELALSSNGLGISPSPKSAKGLDRRVGGKQSILSILLHTQLHVNTGKAPRSQAWKKLTSLVHWLLPSPVWTMESPYPKHPLTSARTWYSVELSLRNTPMGTLGSA